MKLQSKVVKLILHQGFNQSKNIISKSIPDTYFNYSPFGKIVPPIKAFGFKNITSAIKKIDNNKKIYNNLNKSMEDINIIAIEPPKIKQGLHLSNQSSSSQKKRLTMSGLKKLKDE